MKPTLSLKKYDIIRRISATVLLFALCSISLLSQENDTIVQSRDDTFISPERPPLGPLGDSIPGRAHVSDTISKEQLEEGHSPRKAMMYAILMPGLGQAYNKKYWKMPIVYAALGGAVYAIYYNYGQYQLASETFSAIGGQTEINERYLKYWRRNLELSIIGVVAVDALAVVDAYVDANLFYWDVDPDLTLRLEPSIQPIFNASGSLRNNYGFKCSLTF